MEDYEIWAPDYDEDAAYQEARDDRAGFNDWRGDDVQVRSLWL